MEMLVVIAIIALAAMMAIPMMTPFTRSRKVEQAAEVVKSACILARSKAVQQRKKFSVTILQNERLVYLTDYEDLRDGAAVPANVNKYVPSDKTAPYCPHWLGNYNNNEAPATTAATAAAANLRGAVLDHYSRRQGYIPKTIPEGCRFDLGTTAGEAAWTYVFLPTGSAWTARPAAKNEFDGHWLKTTWVDTATNQPGGPVIEFFDGREVRASTTLVVYAMTGQAMRMDVDVNR